MNLNSNFKDIDPIIDKWIMKNSLSIFRGDFRDIAIVDSSGTKFEIRVEPKNFFGQYKIQASYAVNGTGELRENKTWAKKASRKVIEDSLDEAYLEVAKWIKQNGGTRRKAG